MRSTTNDSIRSSGSKCKPFQVQMRQEFANLMETVLIAFRNMIDQLTWMSAYSKKGAYGKIDYLVKNVAYPDFIMDDTALTNYYAALDISTTDSYTELDEKIYIFNMRTSYASLTSNGTERDDFLLGPGLVNAWYQVKPNHFSMPQRDHLLQISKNSALNSVNVTDLSCFQCSLILTIFPGGPRL